MKEFNYRMQLVLAVTKTKLTEPEPPEQLRPQYPATNQQSKEFQNTPQTQKLTSTTSCFSKYTEVPINQT